VADPQTDLSYATKYDILAFMNRNYQSESEKIIDKLVFGKKAPKLLLHSCCAPCSSYVLEYLSQYFEITVLYYNPNIYPDEEYEKRVAEQKQFIRQMPCVHPIDFVEGVFEKELFYELVKGYESCPEGQERCAICYRMRLEAAAKLAAKRNMDYFCTTLSISPLKNAKVLNEIGEELSKTYGVPWLPSDFKKKNGYQRSTEISRQYGLYRQDYCGCVFSLRN